MTPCRGASTPEKRVPVPATADESTRSTPETSGISVASSRIDTSTDFVG